MSFILVHMNGKRMGERERERERERETERERARASAQGRRPPRGFPNNGGIQALLSLYLSLSLSACGAAVARGSVSTAFSGGPGEISQKRIAKTARGKPVPRSSWLQCCPRFPHPESPRSLRISRNPPPVVLKDFPEFANDFCQGVPGISRGSPGPRKKPREPRKSPQFCRGNPHPKKSRANPRNILIRWHSQKIPAISWGIKKKESR